MNIHRFVFSLAVLVFAGALVVGGTGAFFSDEETSTGNVFAAGAIDLRIDSEAHYNGMVCVNGQWQLEDPEADLPDYPAEGSDCVGTWELTDLGPSHTFFNYSDLKPGDEGENTISLHVDNNEAWACVNIIPTENDDVSSNEPELEAGDVEDGDSIFDGELAQNMLFEVWADVCEADDAVPGDNIFQPACDILLTLGEGPIVPTSYPLVTPGEGNLFTGGEEPLDPDTTQYLGIKWSIPTEVGNIIQTDRYKADISFYVEQSRNNPEFVCPELEVPDQGREHVLRLENEIPADEGPWTVIEDGTYADLSWNDGSTFDFDFVAYGLEEEQDYALIYYADGWPGNNPGAYIAGFTTDIGGNIATTSDSVELNTDLPALPDENFPVGAKIWLVLASDYNSGTPSTGPMTAWQPDRYLFEGNVYSHYNDTDI